MKVGDRRRRRTSVSSVIVERTSRSVCGSSGEVLLEVGAALGGRLGGHRGAVDEAADPVAVAGQRLEHRRRRCAARSASAWFWRARIASTALVSRRAGFGAVDDLGEVVAAGGEPGAEVVEDQAEAVGVGLAHDVVDEVEVDRLAVRLERQEALALAGLALLDHRRAPAAARCPRRAAGSARTRRTSRRAATAAGSGRMRPRGSPGSRGRRSAARPRPCPGRGCRRRAPARSPSVTVTSAIRPTLAPAIRTSSPGTRKAPLSKIARTS